MKLTAALLAGLFSQCAPDIAPDTLHAVMTVESRGNPYVVANVTDGTSHSFDNKETAVAFVNDLDKKGKKYSAGLMQIYSENFAGYQLTNETVFDYCTNIRAGQSILKQCYKNALNKEPDKQKALRKALSCYYSGNESRGFKKEESDGKSYIERIENAATDKNSRPLKVPSLYGGTMTENAGHNDIQEAEKRHFMTGGNHNSGWDVFNDYPETENSSDKI